MPSGLRTPRTRSTAKRMARGRRRPVKRPPARACRECGVLVFSWGTGPLCARCVEETAGWVGRMRQEYPKASA